MSRKHIGSVALKEIKQEPKAEEICTDLERLEIKENCRVMTREEKMHEASKPLYLMRYE